MKKMILASTSTLHGSGYLEYIMPEVQKLFDGCRRIVFVPYARPGGISHDEYTRRVSDAFAGIGIGVDGLHSASDPADAIRKAEGIFTGGGNTFVLVTRLYEQNLMVAISEAVAGGTPYLGSSAGSNIAGLTMNTTNDMPIMHPPDFRTMGLVPFNLNPHYLDPDANSAHMGETREMRIREFHEFHDIPVVGLREGSWIEVSGKDIALKGPLSARLFRKGVDPVEVWDFDVFGS